MSTLAPPKPPPVSPPQHASPDVAAPPAAPERDSAIARIAAFAALAGFGVLHWSALVEDAPAGRMLLVVLVATACAAALTLVARLLERLPRPALYALAAALGLVSLALGLLAAGLEARLLLPKHWGELADGLDRGLGGIQGVDWPYDGADAWIHQTILLGAPLLLVVAATIAFWPARRRAAVAVLRAAGLIVLLVFYGSAVTEHDPGEPLLRGLVLLVLVAAWLWLPRVPVREAALGAAAVATVGVVALPLAAALDGGRPWWDYRGWNLFGGGKVVTFRWTHQYGPLDWPRDGTTLLNVKSQRALFWKAESLDTFDGVRWSRSNSSDATNALQGLPSARGPEGPTWEYGEWNPRWNRELRFTVRSLSTDLVVGAGTTYFVRGVGLYSSGSDGTIRLANDRLEEGDSYTVGAYVPTPTAKQMRASPDGLRAVLLPFTTVEVPEPSGFEPGRRREVKVPLWGGGAVGDTAFGDPEAPARALNGSVYSRMYGEATRVTSGAPSMYDAVKQVRDYLNEEFSYSEKPRRARYPLNAFMFRDGFGYCQQFSGAMALMLRMVGIPARIGGRFRAGLLQPRHGGVPRTRPRRALVGRGVLQRHRLGDLRPDARRRPGRAPAGGSGRHERIAVERTW